MLLQVEKAVKRIVDFNISLNENLLQSHEESILQLEGTLDSLDNLISVEETAISSLKSQTSISLLNTFVQIYSSRLGLRITKPGPSLQRFEFLHIAPDPASHFLTLHLDANLIYSISESSHDLPILSDLLELLNSKNDISAFIVSIRKAFKALYLN